MVAKYLSAEGQDVWYDILPQCSQVQTEVPDTDQDGTLQGPAYVRTLVALYVCVETGERTCD